MLYYVRKDSTSNQGLQKKAGTKAQKEKSYSSYQGQDVLSVAQGTDTSPAQEIHQEEQGVSQVQKDIQENKALLAGKKEVRTPQA
jgi:hypothetical protein